MGGALGECQQNTANQGESSVVASSMQACARECTGAGPAKCYAFDWSENGCYFNTHCYEQDNDNYSSCKRMEDKWPSDCAHIRTTQNGKCIETVKYGDDNTYSDNQSCYITALITLSTGLLIGRSRIIQRAIMTSYRSLGKSGA